MDIYMDRLKNLPSSLMASRRRPNLPPNIYPPKYVKTENFTEKKKIPVNKMVSPSQVLPNSNVLMNNGHVVNGLALSQHSAASNSVSTPVRSLPGGNTLLSNGNSVSPSPAVANSPALPVAVVNSHVVMSNGNTVSPQNVSNIPAQPQNSANTQSPPPMNVRPSPSSISAGNTAANSLNHSMVENMESNYQAMAANTNLQGACPIAPPARVNNYCTPAPFHSVGGEAYFPVGSAYGRPIAG